MPASQIVFIGPVCAGKTTLLRLVAGRLGLLAMDLDEVADPYYDEVGRGHRALQEKGDEVGFLASYRWWQQGHPHSVRRVFEDYPHAAVALGAGHTHYQDQRLFDEVAAALSLRYPILVLPSPDLDRSVDVLRARSVAGRGMDWRYGDVDFIEQWVMDPPNHVLARWTVYTENRTPDQTAAEIVDHLGGQVEGNV